MTERSKHLKPLLNGFGQLWDLVRIVIFRIILGVDFFGLVSIGNLIERRELGLRLFFQIIGLTITHINVR